MFDIWALAAKARRCERKWMFVPDEMYDAYVAAITIPAREAESIGLGIVVPARSGSFLLPAPHGGVYCQGVELLKESWRLPNANPVRWGHTRE